MKFKNNMKKKIFISYSHKDRELVKKLREYLCRLEKEGLAKIWYDDRVLGGNPWRKDIDHNINESDLILYCVSDSFLKSQPCKDEINIGYKLNEERNVVLVPIILSKCDWKNFPRLSEIQALPIDGRAIDSYEKDDFAFQEIYEGMKKIINLLNIKITNLFEKKLNDANIVFLGEKKKYSLGDIYVWPELSFEEKSENKKISSERIISNISSEKKIIIAGAISSGKTSLCKQLYKKLKDKNFIPIFLTFEKNLISNLEKRLQTSIANQYDGNIELDALPREKIVIIIDDFYSCKKKELFLKKIEKYEHQIVIVDDLFNLDISDENIMRSYKKYQICEFSPALRDELIRRWIDIEEEQPERNNEYYAQLDSMKEFVNTTLGKTFSKGIMPAFPFFILTIATVAKSNPNLEMTSQGYYYFSLLTLSLIRNGVKEKLIDTYVNFLSEVAFHFYQLEEKDVYDDEFKEFINEYRSNYNLPVEDNELLSKLEAANIFGKDSFNRYRFYHKYSFYFFIAKYISEHVTKKKDLIDKILSNLDDNINVYIAIFISHHLRTNFEEEYLSILLKMTRDLYKGVTPIYLNNEEVKRLDECSKNIMKRRRDCSLVSALLFNSFWWWAGQDSDLQCLPHG